MKQHPLSARLRSSGSVSIEQLRRDKLSQALQDTVQVHSDVFGRHVIVFDRHHLESQISELAKSGLGFHQLLQQGIEQALKTESLQVRSKASLNGSMAQAMFDNKDATKHYASSLSYYIQDSLATDPEYSREIKFDLIHPGCLGYHSVIEQWNTEEQLFWACFLHTHVSQWIVNNIDEKEDTLSMLQTQHYSRGVPALKDILERWWWAWAKDQTRRYQHIALWLNLTTAQTQQLAAAAFLCNDLNVNGPACSFSEIISYLSHSQGQGFADKRAIVKFLTAAHGVEINCALTTADCVNLVSEVYQIAALDEQPQPRHWLQTQLQTLANNA